VDELERTRPQWQRLPPPISARNSALLSRYKDQAAKLQMSKHCSDAGLLDEALFRRCLSFYGSVCQFATATMTNGVNRQGQFDPKSLVDRLPELPLNGEEVPPAFAALPEWVIDDLADFLLFGLQ